MTDSTMAWHERDLDRRSARQRSQVDTAKILVTFSVGVAAAIAASALQVSRFRAFDVVCVSLLGLAFLLAFAVVVLDRTTAVDRDSLLAEAQLRGWSDEKLLLEFTIALTASTAYNEHVVDLVKRVALLQVAVAFLSATAGSVSLLSH
ncbi:hypothetical protein ACWED2_13475 [Amycolatopsis sp. NPDC005003]